MLKIVRNAERGHLDHGWLKTAHSFSFGRYYNPEYTHFGALLVVNEDHIAPGAGFAEHFHDNMEIVTIPLSGALAHGDSMGNSSVIHAGDVQIMSAGTGIMHSEKNDSHEEPVHLVQIWIVPNQKSLPTRYEQITLGPLPQNQWVTVAGPEAHKGQLQIHQDASIQLATFEKGCEFSLAQQGNRGAFILVLHGEFTCGDSVLHAGDAIMGQIDATIACRVNSSAMLLRIDVPLHESA